jgi:ubiquinone biosynthesis protein
MKIITRPLRLARIIFIMMRYNVDEIVLGKHWFFPLRLAVYFNPFYWTTGRKLPRGVRIRLATEKLGPIFVKAGQIVSTRRDLLPEDVTSELAKLQDRVPPFSGKKAKAIIEQAQGCRIEEVFNNFDMKALASASIAQVHTATLQSGESVVIKVLRPNIRGMIDRDVDLLMTLANIADRYWYNARHFKPKQIVNEVAQTLYDELDLMREASNASQLKRNFKDSDILHIPQIYWRESNANMLVMERINGIPIHDIERLKAAGVDMRKLAERGIEIFFTQIFRDSFFHADLHPGNIFVSIEDPQNPTFMMVDFGIVGSLSKEDQRYIAENMIAFFKRDYQRVAELHIACGWLPPNTRIDQFEGAIRAVSEPIFEQSPHDVSFGQLLLKLFQVARNFQINIQPQLILLQKTLLGIESLSSSISDEVEIWTYAGPQVEKWLKKQIGIISFFRRLKENLPLWSEQLPQVPSLLYEVLSETRKQQVEERFKLNANNNHRSDFKLKLGYFAAGTMTTALIVIAYFWR